VGFGAEWPAVSDQQHSCELYYCRSVRAVCGSSIEILFYELTNIDYLLAREASPTAGCINRNPKIFRKKYLPSVTLLLSSLLAAASTAEFPQPARPIPRQILPDPLAVLFLGMDFYDHFGASPGIPGDMWSLRRAAMFADVYRACPFSQAPGLFRCAATVGKTE